MCALTVGRVGGSGGAGVFVGGCVCRSGNASSPLHTHPTPHSAGALDTLTRSTNLFTAAGSSSQNFFRNVATFDGSGAWATGQSTVNANVGLMHTPFGATTSNRIILNQATNHRYVLIGPSWPGSGAAASTPQLYLSFAAPTGMRGIHAVGAGLPTSNQTGGTGGGGTVLLPGFAKYNTASCTTDFNCPLIQSFAWEADGRTLWTADSQAFGAMTPAPSAKYNIVSYYWNDATAQYDRGLQMAVDPVQILYAIHGRVEAGVWVLYSVMYAS